VRQHGKAGPCIKIAAVIVHAFRMGTESDRGYDRLKDVGFSCTTERWRFLMKRSVLIQPFAVPYKKASVFYSIAFFSFLTFSRSIDRS